MLLSSHSVIRFPTCSQLSFWMYFWPFHKLEQVQLTENIKVPYGLNNFNTKIQCGGLCHPLWKVSSSTNTSPNSSQQQHNAPLTTPIHILISSSLITNMMPDPHHLSSLNFTIINKEQNSFVTCLRLVYVPVSSWLAASNLKPHFSFPVSIQCKTRGMK